jgi:hypothetical protein
LPLGLEIQNKHEEDGKPVWACVASSSDDPNDARARLMLALADEPIDPTAQGVLFCCWTPDVHRLHEGLARACVDVGEVE